MSIVYANGEHYADGSWTAGGLPTGDLHSKYLEFLRAGVNTPVTVLVAELDDQFILWSDTPITTADTLPIIKSISSWQNKIDPTKGYSTRGNVTVTLTGTEEIKKIIANYRLNNRRVTRYEGFIGLDFLYFYASFTGRIRNWSRNGGDIQLTISDDLKDGSSIDIPEANETKTQSLVLSNMNVMDIMTYLLEVYLNNKVLTNSDFILWSSGTTSAPDGYTLSGLTIARSDDSRYGQYSAGLTRAGTDGKLTFTEPYHSKWAGKLLTLTGWVKSSIAGATIEIDDGVYSASSVEHSGSGLWERLTVSLAISAIPTKLELSMAMAVDGTIQTDSWSAYPGDTILTNIEAMESEKNIWLNGWNFDRVLTEPVVANDILNDLQRESNTFLPHDGEQISAKVFAPALPGQTIEIWSDEDVIVGGSLTQESGYQGNHYTHVRVLYDYDESGSDGFGHYQSIKIRVDASAKGVDEWDETKTKDVYCKYIRTRSFTQPVNITGIKMYHMSKENPFGDPTGTLTYTYDAGGGHTLQWTPPSGSIGTAVIISADGQYQLFGADPTKSIKVRVTYADLPGSSQSDAITVTGLNGDGHATALGARILARYRNPRSKVRLMIDTNDLTFNDAFRKPADFVDLKTDQASEYGDLEWDAERCMILSIRPTPKKHRVEVELMETAMYRKYGFIAPSGYPDWDSASDAQKEYAFIGDVPNNQLGVGNDPGSFIW